MEYGIESCYKTFDELLKMSDYDFISEINCSNNNLTFLPKLPVYLVTLDCSNNNLTELLELPPFLECLNCSNNKLDVLPEFLPNTLGWLYVSDNNLTELPILPLPLRILYCSNNKLNNLPALPRKVKYVYCINNNLTNLPDMPENLHYIIYDTNPIYEFIDTYFYGSKTSYFEWKDTYKKIFSNKLADWFLECKYNPKYKYCRDRVNMEYDELIKC